MTIHLGKTEVDEALILLFHTLLAIPDCNFLVSRELGKKSAAAGRVQGLYRSCWSIGDSFHYCRSLRSAGLSRVSGAALE